MTRTNTYRYCSSKRVNVKFGEQVWSCLMWAYFELLRLYTKCMGGANSFRNSSSKRVNVNVCGQVSSFYRNLCRYQVLYVVVLWLLSYVSSTTRRRRRRRKRTPWTKCIIWPKSGSLMKYLVHKLLLTCSVL